MFELYGKKSSNTSAHAYKIIISIGTDVLILFLYFIKWAHWDVRQNKPTPRMKWPHAHVLWVKQHLTMWSLEALKVHWCIHRAIDLGYLTNTCPMLLKQELLSMILVCRVKTCLYDEVEDLNTGFRIRVVHKVPWSGMKLWVFFNPCWENFSLRAC